MSQLKITTLERADEADWDHYVTRHHQGTLYHLAFWRQLVEKVFGHRTHFRVATNASGEICGCLPLVQIRSRLFGHFMVSMPYFNYGGALGDSDITEGVLIDDAIEIAQALGAGHVEFRDMKLRTGDRPTRDDKVNMHLRLPEAVEDLWGALGSKLRAQVRRPGTSAEVRSGGEELLNDFYKVFSRNMRDLGTPVYGKSFFRSILQAYERSFIITVYLERRPVASGFLLGHKNSLEIPWASSLREYNRLGANMLLYWEALKRAVQDGYEIFDFGRSSRDSGTYRFKKQWGAQPVQLYWTYWLREGSPLPDLSPSNPRYNNAIAAWRRLPVPLANVLGPRIVKYLP